MSLVVVYASTKVSEMEEKETFYTKQESQLDQCYYGDILIVLGDFNKVTGTDRAGYEMCIGPTGCVTRTNNSFILLNLAISTRLRNADSWYQRSALAGVLRRRLITSSLVLRRILQNFKVYRSAEFFLNDHKLVPDADLALDTPGQHARWAEYFE